MLAIGRALVSNPKVMLLDEPSSGLAVGIVRAFVDAVKHIRDTGVAILLVEQNLEIAAALADSCIVLAAGRVVWRGSVRDATNSEAISKFLFFILWFLSRTSVGPGEARYGARCLSHGRGKINRCR